jgi:hypothetical protein
VRAAEPSELLVMDRQAFEEIVLAPLFDASRADFQRVWGSGPPADPDRTAVTPG